MSAARETEQAVNSGNETDSGVKNNSGPKPHDANANADNPSKRDSETKPSAAIDIESVGTPPASSSSESSKAGAENEPSLGKTLTAARERRGVSRADVVAETRIPAHYLDMIENSDYGLISDQLYLMPFLRRYAAFLNLDGEEVAMRFVREVQRAEVAAAVPRMSEPLASYDRKQLPWGRVAAVVIVLSAIVVLYIIASEHHHGELGFRKSSPPAEPAVPSGAVPPADAPASMAAPAPLNAPVTMAPPAPVTAPAPMTARAPMTAPPPMAASAPPAAAPMQVPETSVASAPKASTAKRPRKAPPSRATAPADSSNE